LGLSPKHDCLSPTPSEPGRGHSDAEHPGPRSQSLSRQLSLDLRTKLRTGLSRSTSWMRMQDAGKVNSQRKLLPPSGNANMPADYVWLEEPIRSLASDQAHTLGCVDVASGEGFTPLFFCLGACPNTFCGMQVVMFCLPDRKDEIDFWWVKPKKGNLLLEPNTLGLHKKGTYKNDPGRSRPVFKPLADLFSQNTIVGRHSFGIEPATAREQSPRRAYIDQKDGDSTQRYYLAYIWQEDWTTNPFARVKSTRGKLVYQKQSEALRFYSRQYCITQGSSQEVIIYDDEDPPFETLLPDTNIKALWEYPATTGGANGGG